MTGFAFRHVSFGYERITIVFWGFQGEYKKQLTLCSGTLWGFITKWSNKCSVQKNDFICRLWKQLFTTHVYVFLLVGDLKWLSLLLQLQGRKSGEEGDQWKLLVYVSLQTYARLWTSYRSYTYFSLNHDVFLNQTKRVWLQQSCCFGSHLPSYLWKLWVFR